MTLGGCSGERLPCVYPERFSLPHLAGLLHRPPVARYPNRSPVVQMAVRWRKWLCGHWTLEPTSTSVVSPHEHATRPLVPGLAGATPGSAPGMGSRAAAC